MTQQNLPMPLGLDAASAARAMAAGELTSETLVRACLERIAKRESIVKAWSWLDPDQAIRSARERDKERAIGVSLGPLHGLPIGVKDVIDVGDGVGFTSIGDVRSTIGTDHSKPKWYGSGAAA